MLDSLIYCEEENISSSIEKRQPLQISKGLKEIVLNTRSLANGQLHHTLYLQKRCQALTTVVSQSNIYSSDYNICTNGNTDLHGCNLARQPHELNSRKTCKGG